MRKAELRDKIFVIDILTKSFEENQSVNYIIRQDGKRIKRINKLMDYSFEICYRFGNVFLSNDQKSCALILYPDKKKTTLKSILLDARLIFSCIGLSNIKKVMRREAMIKRLQPNEKLYYLWFIGVDPSYQSKGIGSKLLEEIIEDSDWKKRAIYLETSTLNNLSWYKKFGFYIYNELELTYKLFFLKKDISVKNAC